MKYAAIVLSLVVLGVPVNASAQTWINGVRLVEVSSYNLGNNNYIQIKIEGLPSATGCAPTDNNGVLTKGLPNQHIMWQMIYSTALAAQSQDALVDLYVAGCHASQGLVLNGMRIHNPN